LVLREIYIIIVGPLFPCHGIKKNREEVYLCEIKMQLCCAEFMLLHVIWLLMFCSSFYTAQSFLVYLSMVVRVGPNIFQSAPKCPGFRTFQRNVMIYFRILFLNFCCLCNKLIRESSFWD
jgi:hypothetical protein